MIDGIGAFKGTARRPFLTPVAVLMAALAFRFVLLAWANPGIPVDGDTPSYLAIARSLAEGKGYSMDGAGPTAIRMPLYPFFLAGILSVPGTGVGTVLFVQILLDSITCLMAFFLARKLLDSLHAVVTGFLTALYLPCAYFSIVILSETLFCFLVTGSLLVLSFGDVKPRLTVLSGGIMGLAALTRPNGIIVAGFVILWLALFRRKPRQVILYSLAVITFMTPWTVRNAIEFRHFIPTYSLNGITFYNSYVLPKKGYGFNSLQGVPENYHRLDNEGDRNAYLIRYTFHYISEHPLSTAMSIPVKTALLVYPFDMKWLIPSSPFKYNVFWGAVFLLGCLGCAKRFRWMAERLSLLFFPLLSLCFTALLLYGSPRIRVPFDPLIAVIASVGLVWIWRRRDRIAWCVGMVAVHGFLAAAGSLSTVSDILRRIMR